jgi:hypothetical protein
MHPAAAGEAPAATESEAPITTQVLAADDVCQPLAFAVFACTGKGVLADNPLNITHTRFGSKSPQT